MFDQIRKLIDDRAAEMNVAMPAIIRSFDAAKQTVKADIAIKKLDGTTFTQLVDVPIMIPTCAGFSLTLPIVAGDECLVVFADRCIDNWHTRGGVQDQAEHRLHNVGDGFAIIGVNSTPRFISAYNTTDAELRNGAGDQYVRLKAGKDIEITTPTNVTVNCVDAAINCDTATITADTSVTIDTPATDITGTLDVGGLCKFNGGFESTGVAKNDGKNIGDDHTHGGVMPGGASTGVPN
jgi:phage baseplate assembly protein gpV